MLSHILEGWLTHLWSRLDDNLMRGQSPGYGGMTALITLRIDQNENLELGSTDQLRYDIDLRQPMILSVVGKMGTSHYDTRS